MKKKFIMKTRIIIAKFFFYEFFTYLHTFITKTKSYKNKIKN